MKNKIKNFGYICLLIVANIIGVMGIELFKKLVME